MTEEQRNEMMEAISHLGTALSQTIPSDDQIIVEHMRKAHEILLKVWRASK